MAFIYRQTSREPETQTKNLDAVLNGVYEVTPDEGYLLDKVNVGVNVPISMVSDYNTVINETTNVLSLLCNTGNTTMTEINDNLITTINTVNAFNNYTSITSVIMNALNTISGNYAFYGCTSITSVTMNALNTISGSNAFYGCTSITSVTMNALNTISGSNAFYGCSSITSVTMNALNTISGNSAFNYLISLESITLNNLTTISNQSVLLGCYALQSVTMNALTTISGNYTLSGGSSRYMSIKELYFPELKSVSGSYNFIYSELESIRMPKLETWSSGNAFFSCLFLSEIVIGTNFENNLSLYNWNPSRVTDDALINANFVSGIIDNLFDYSGGTMHTIQLSAALLARLTTATIDAATAKNWAIAS